MSAKVTTTQPAFNAGSATVAQRQQPGLHSYWEHTGKQVTARQSCDVLVGAAVTEKRREQEHADQAARASQSWLPVGGGGL